MQLEYNELENGVRLIKLSGKLDITGVNKIDLNFTAHCGGDNARVVVDLAGVDYLASIGIRMLTTNAKSLNSRGGRMVLLGPTEDVRSVLEMTGIPAVIPMYDSLESAQAVLMV